MTNMKKRLEQLETQTAAVIVGDVVFVRPGKDAPTDLPPGTTVVKFIRPDNALHANRAKGTDHA